MSMASGTNSLEGLKVHRSQRNVPAAITDVGCEREINEDRYAVIECAVGRAWIVCDGMGGALGAEIIAIQPTYPFEQLVFFLIVVSVGGLGSLKGPFFAALLIGVLDTACKYWIPEVGAFFIYIVTIGILLWRPLGLMGKRA